MRSHPPPCPQLSVRSPPHAVFPAPAVSATDWPFPPRHWPSSSSAAGTGRLKRGYAAVEQALAGAAAARRLLVPGRIAVRRHERPLDSKRAPGLPARHGPAANETIARSGDGRRRRAADPCPCQTGPCCQTAGLHIRLLANRRLPRTGRLAARALPGCGPWDGQAGRTPYLTGSGPWLGWALAPYVALPASRLTRLCPVVRPPPGGARQNLIHCAVLGPQPCRPIPLALTRTVFSRRSGPHYDAGHSLDDRRPRPEPRPPRGTGLGQARRGGAGLRHRPE